MSYRSFEQPSVATTTSSTASSMGAPTKSSQNKHRMQKVTPASILAATQALKRNRFLIPVGAASATLALGISSYARGQRMPKLPYKNPFPAGKSVLKDPELKRIFYCGNTQHIYSSLAIMASPFTSSRPFLTSSLLLGGIALFCGTQYYRTFKEQPESTPPLLLIGSLCLLSGWLTFLL